MTPRTRARDLGDPGRYWFGVYCPFGYTVLAATPRPARCATTGRWTWEEAS